MSNLNEAKNKLKLILEGKNPKKPTLEEARKNLIKNMVLYRNLYINRSIKSWAQQLLRIPFMNWEVILM